MFDPIVRGRVLPVRLGFAHVVPGPVVHGSGDVGGDVARPPQRGDVVIVRLTHRVVRHEVRCCKHADVLGFVHINRKLENGFSIHLKHFSYCSVCVTVPLRSQNSTGDEPQIPFKGFVLK